jgi:uncharacterized short protein YbdD (DUF466 family)
MRYKEMVEDAKAKGLTSEKEMWVGIVAVDNLLESMKEAHPEKYWEFMREQHGVLYKGHYDEEFARYDVSQMQPHGEYWTCKEIEEATKGMQFPAGTTIWDKYVAFNAQANDLDGMDVNFILESAYKFYFADKDWHNGVKLWNYMLMAHKKAPK